MPTWPRRIRAPTSRGKAACRADLLTRIGFDPADRRAGHRDDRAARSAEGLRPAGRRGADAARARASGSSSRAAATRPWPDPFRALAAANPTRVALHRALRPGDGAPDLRRRRLLRDAVAVRAVRPGPDDRPALRDAADRPPDRRPRRHGHRRDDASRATGPASRSTGATVAGLLGACDAAVAMFAARRPGLGRRCSIAGWRSTSTG